MEEKQGGGGTGFIEKTSLKREEQRNRKTGLNYKPNSFSTVTRKTHKDFKRIPIILLVAGWGGTEGSISSQDKAPVSEF